MLKCRGLKNAKTVMVSGVASVKSASVAHLNTTIGLTVSWAPNLHWQRTVTSRRSEPKLIS